MTSPPTIAVAHYPEGVGHATRMLAIADALGGAGATVEMAGGGAGTAFVALNGYDEFEPTTVDYIDTYQGGSIRRVLAESVPATAARVTEYVEWLRDPELDALVTDDMFAAIAATRTDVPLYVLKHDVPALYRDRIERAGASFHTSFQLSAARAFFYPTVWPRSDADPDGVTRVPPVALDGDDRERPAPEVLVVPSHYSDLGRIADQLVRQGYDVLDVGSDDWDPVASLLPYVRDADVVVCSGYSTVMDAAVAGTPCVVHPATDEQDAVAGWLDRFDVPGFAVAPEPLDVLEAVDSPPDPPDFENGAGVVAETVMDDVTDGGSATAGSSGSDPATLGRTGTAADRTDAPDDRGRAAVGAARARVGAARRRSADRLVAGATALGTALRAVVVRGRTLAVGAKRRLSAGAVAIRRHAARTWRTLVAHVRAAATTAGSVGRTTARCWHRYRTATAAMSVAAVVVARNGIRGTAAGPGAGLGTGAASFRETVDHGLGRATERLRGLAAVAASTAKRFTTLGRRLANAGRFSE
jgi:hypothetical protein